MFSAKFNLLKPFSRLVKKQKLETLDYVYKAQPFCDVVSKNQNNYNLDTIYRAQPFVGTPNNHIKTIPITGVNHPDVDYWLNTVTLNGGSASSSTIAALNIFCNSIDSTGLRSKFYRLNLFCGNNLQSSLVPLYTGPSVYLPTQNYGYGSDIGINFSNINYIETGPSGGLSANGSNMYINPGMSILGNTGNESMSCYVMQESTTSTYYLLGSHAQSNANRTLGITYYNGSYKLEDGHTGGEFDTGFTAKTIGFRSAASSGLSMRKMYLNGSLIFTSLATAVVSTGVVTPYIFCRNNSGAAFGLGNQRIGSYHIGVSMSDDDMTNLYNAIQTFQTALNRNV